MTSVDCPTEPGFAPISSPQLASSPRLDGLPEEIIEYITECMRYPIYPRPEATEAFLNEGCTGFSTARFSLSAFSKVCKAIRVTAERLLYRDIHVDIVVWTPWMNYSEDSDTQKHPVWPAACLHLLLGTFEERPELRRFVRSVAIRWSDLESSASVIQEQLEFLRLAFSSLPELLLEPLERLNLQITSFAALTQAMNLPRIIQIFPNLPNLHLQIHGNPSSFSIPENRISELHLNLIGDRNERNLLLNLALAVPHHVRRFHLEANNMWKNLPVIPFPPPTPSMQASVEHLRLKTIDPFKTVKINECICSPLATMSALRHLHIMRQSVLPVHAFDSLPTNLRSITFSDYALDSTKSAADSKSSFVQSVVDCLNTHSRTVKLAGVKTYGAIPDDPWELGDLAPLQMLCRADKVPFIQIGAYADIEPELILFFKEASRQSI
ncbi:hypothetical protein DFH06DRAFT_1191525 [Mycena polygramma]|nr:hypothetical protein DFH06DRAFT_1191525 [Mycena polygramma]